MAEPEPESQGALDLPAVHVLGPDWAETDCPISVRELTTRLRAAGAAGARPSWSAYIPPAKASDALPVDDLVDMDVVDEMDELDEEEAEELAMQVLSSLEDKAKAAVLEAPGTGKQRKHPITALSWCTLSAEEGRWTSELRAAAAAEGAPPPAAELAKGLSIFELAQYAIVSKGDAGVGLKRLEAVAALQKEYGWERLSPEESMAWCDEKFPGCWLASGNDALGRPAMGSDIANYVPSFSTAEDWSLLMRLCIDMMDAMTCDLDDVRAAIGLLKELRERESAIDEYLSPVEDMYAMLARYEVALGKDEIDMVGDLRYTWKKLLAVANEVSADLQSFSGRYGDGNAALENQWYVYLP